MFYHDIYQNTIYLLKIINPYEQHTYVYTVALHFDFVGAIEERVVLISDLEVIITTIYSAFNCDIFSVNL